MLDAISLYKFASRYGVGKSTVASDLTSYETYLGECRRAITDRTPSEYYAWDEKKQLDFTEKLIIDFANNNSKPVEGFIEDGVIKVAELINTLKKNIMDFGILEDALADEDVQEIQINDKNTIWVVRNGKNELYRDKRGNPYQFVSNEELKATIQRMCYNPNGDTKRMTRVDPLLNARASRSGYRISAVNDSAITPDVAPFDFPVTSVTIRKFSTKRLTYDNLVAFGSLTPRMAKLMKCCSMADTRMFFVGPVSSGKTTLLGCALWDIPSSDRVILIQNPTEIVMYNRDVNGTNTKNVLHWEAESIPDNEVTESKPTMSNLISHALRNSGDVIVPGESRIPQEFYELYRAILTGHRALGTFHSDDGLGALERMANEVATAAGGNKNDYIGSLASFIDIIVSQYKLVDGSRKVMEISEPTGKLDEAGRPVINKIFEFKLSKRSDKDADGNIKKVHGQFIQVGVIDKDGELAKKLYKAGFDEEELSEFFDKSNIGKEIT